MTNDRLTSPVLTLGVIAIIFLAGVFSGQAVMGQNRVGGPGILSLQCDGMPVAPLSQNDTSAFKRLLTLFESSILDSSQVPQGPAVETVELEDSLTGAKVVCVFMSLS